MAKTWQWNAGEWSSPNPRFKHPYSGPRWAYEIAKEVVQYPEVVDPRLHAQARGYVKLGGAYEAIGYTPQQTAEKLYREGRKFSGWSREVIFESLHKFEPGPEEARMLEPFQQATSFGGREWAERWSKAAVLNKYVKAVGHTQSVEALAEQAVQAGVGEEWGRRVVAQRPILGEAVEEALKRAKTLPARRGFAPVLKSAMSTLWKRKVPIGIVGGVSALYFSEPGNWFSGKDDAWNTIEGLPHGGESEKMRRLLTDFGSGMIGSKVMKRAMSLFRGTAEKRLVHSPVFGKMKLTPQQNVVEQVLERVREAQFAHRPSRAGATFWSPNPRVAAQYAGPMGSGGHVGSIKATEGTFYTRQDIVTEMVKTMHGKDPNKKKILLEQAQKYWRGVDPSEIKGTKAWNEIEALVPGEVSVERLWGIQPGRRGNQKWNVIEGLRHGGEAQKMRRKMTDFGSGWIGKLIRRFTQRGVKQTASGWEISAASLAQMSPKKYSQFSAKYAVPKEPLPFYQRPLASWAPTPEEVMKFEKENVILRQGMTEIPTGPEIIRKWGTPSQRKLQSALDILEQINKEQAVGKKMAQAGTYTGPRPISTEAATGVHGSIEGLSHGPMGKKGNTDAGFGSPWRGILQKFKMLRTERAYKKLVSSAIKEKGISTKGIKWDVISYFEDRGLAIDVFARTQENKLITHMSRYLGKGEVNLTSIEVAEGSRLGKLLYTKEEKVLRSLGYGTGTKIVSPVSNPITARWQAQMYGSIPAREEVKTDIVTRLINKQISKDEFQVKYAGEFVGELRRKRWYAKHKEAQVRASAFSYRPGRRHTQQTGRIVQ